jgi:hypothetical protein
MLKVPDGIALTGILNSPFVSVVVVCWVEMMVMVAPANKLPSESARTPVRNEPVTGTGGTTSVDGGTLLVLFVAVVAGDLPAPPPKILLKVDPLHDNNNVPVAKRQAVTVVVLKFPAILCFTPGQLSSSQLRENIGLVGGELELSPGSNLLK